MTPDQTTAESTTDGWGWWASDGADIYTVGPEPTREAVIQAAVDDELGYDDESENGPRCVFQICEARQDPIRLSDWIEVESILEQADDGLANNNLVSEYDEPPYFDVTQDQEADLIRRLKTACDEWQDVHGLVFVMHQFSSSRNEETVTVKLGDDA